MKDLHVCNFGDICLSSCSHKYSHSHVAECNFPCNVHKDSKCVYDLKGERVEKLNKIKKSKWIRNIF